MATHAVTLSSTGPMGDVEDMTDEQMQELLAQAASRLQQKAQLQEARKEQDFKIPKLGTGEIARTYTTSKSGVARMDGGAQVADKERSLSNRIRKVEDPVTVSKRKAEAKKATAGDQWYNLPKTELTPEFKRDLQLIKMRNVLDPHRHYKKDNGKMKAPEYSQVATVVEGPTEFYSARVANRDRKRTFVEEVLAGERETGRFKNKYDQVQSSKTSGKKAYYNDLKAKRKASFKKR